MSTHWVELKAKDYFIASEAKEPLYKIYHLLVISFGVTPRKTHLQIRSAKLKPIAIAFHIFVLCTIRILKKWKENIALKKTLGQVRLVSVIGGIVFIHA